MNPAFIPRNHQVEQAITGACRDRDYARMDELLVVARDPYTWRDKYAHLALAPTADEEVLQTFCGT